MKYKYTDTTGEHLHSLEGKPLIGTSKVTGVISKPLTWWAAELAAVECLEEGVKIPTIREEYLSACESNDKKKAIDELQKKYPIFKKARFAHFSDKNKKADKGTDMHAELEKYVKLMISDQDGKPLEMNGYDHKAVEIFAQWAVKNVSKFLYSEIHCYSEKMWVGGISDCGFIDKQGKVAILDFKSSKDAFISQFIQIAGYDLQLSENGGYTAEGKKIFELEKPVDYYVVFPFGAEKPEGITNYDVESLREGFKSALTLYKLTN